MQLRQAIFPNFSYVFNSGHLTFFLDWYGTGTYLFFKAVLRSPSYLKPELLKFDLLKGLIKALLKLIDEKCCAENGSVGISKARSRQKRIGSAALI